MNGLWWDIKYGARVLMKNPGFTAVAVLTLALGIGANSAIFSIVNAVLLNPLPFPNPERLVAVYSTTETLEQSSISYPNFLEWQAQNHSFEQLGAFRTSNYNLTGSGEPQRLHAHMISAQFLPAYGTPVLLGRNFTVEEDRPGGAAVAILGSRLWKSTFGESRDVLGRTITLNAKPYTIVGVAQTHITGLSDTDIYVPVGQWTDPTFLNRRISMGLNAIGRLKSGVTLTQAQAEMDSIARNQAAAYPEADKGRGIGLVPLKTDVVGDVRAVLWVLMGAVGFVLLIACANVASLLLARSTGRAREFAVRTALGASPGRVVRQLLTESVMLGVAGGGLGLVIAQYATRGLLAALPQGLPRAEEVSLDPHVALFTAALSILTGILFGLAPALRILRPDVHETLKEGGRGSSGSRHRMQHVFVVLETAMAVVLLVGAGLMIRSLAALWGLNPGFDPHNVLTFSLSWTSQPGMTPAMLRAKHRAILENLAGVPGVESAAIQAGSLPMAGDSEVPFWIEGHPKPANDNEMPFALFYLESQGYTPAMRIPLERGRLITDRDDDHSPTVALIDTTFAKKFFPNEDPVGKHINVGLLDMQPEIVGVVGHVEHWGLGSREHQNLQAQIYLPIWQIPDKFWTLLADGSEYVARTHGAPLSVVGALREAAHKADGTAVLYSPQPMDEIVQNSIAKQRFAMMLLSVFSALALTLSTIGIYGVISYLAGQRVHEIGVRMALGASARDVLRMVLGEGMRMAMMGVAIGAAAALGLARLLTNLMYGVGATDPPTFLGVALVLLGVTLLACYVPARRAMRVDPIVALRYE